MIKIVLLVFVMAGENNAAVITREVDSTAKCNYIGAQMVQSGLSNKKLDGYSFAFTCRTFKYNGKFANN